MAETSKKETRYAALFKKLRLYIAENNMKPGDVLPSEEELCKKYNVSRNIMREALKGLSAMGVIEGHPGIGNVIQPFSVEELINNVLFCSAQNDTKFFLQMMDVRKKLELAYMREAYKTLTDEDIRKLRGLMEKIEVDLKDSVGLNENDREFHRILFSHIDNAPLHAVLSCAWAIDEKMNPISDPRPLWEMTANKHKNIVLALENRNMEAFEAAMMIHFSTGKFAFNENSRDIEVPVIKF